MSARRTGWVLLLLCAACLPGRNDAPPQQELDHLDALVRRERIGALLTRTSPKDFHGLDITVHGETAILEGEVPSQTARELAENLALSVAGVHRVVNRLLVVKPPPPEDEKSEDAEAKAGSPP